MTATSPPTEVRIGRQPIHDRRLDVIAYELHYDGISDRDPRALASLFVAGMVDVGLERLAGDRAVVIQLPETLLRDGTLATLPLERLVVDVPAGGRVDDELDALLRSAVASGLQLRLPDPVTHPEVAALLDVASMVAVDVTPLDPDTRRIRRSAVARDGIQVLATGVDSHEVHDDAVDAGYDLFTGTVLSQPRVVAGRRLATQPAVLLDLIARLDDPDGSVDGVEKVISADPRLSYQVLRYVNSAFVGLRQQVESVRQAVVLVGPPVLRRLADMLLLQETSDKPLEAHRLALVRAAMCTAVGEALGDPRPAHHTVGLLSTVDLLTDVAIEEAIADLPLTDEVVDALLHHEGRLGRVLQAVKLYERCDWDDPVIASFDPVMLAEAYFRALASADETLQRTRELDDAVSAPSAVAP